MQSPNTVRKYFQAKSVLLTGATGFLGKFIVFKLIKLCAVTNIFVVLRPKKNETVEQRFANFLKSDIFD
ncbi:putative fatty acyl-CoA reductase-like isoform X2, partial [Leptotrombidium deliense]